MSSDNAFNIDDFYADYGLLNDVATERDSLALALNVSLERNERKQRYAIHFNALLERWRQWRTDPNCSIEWPLSKDIASKIPEWMPQYLEECKARVRVMRNGEEQIQVGVAKPMPAWSRLKYGLEQDEVLWKWIARVVNERFPSKVRVDPTTKNVMQTDFHLDIAATIHLKVFTAIICCSHEWYERRNKYESWRGLLFRRGSGLSDMVRANRRARGLTGLDEDRAVVQMENPGESPSVMNDLTAAQIVEKEELLERIHTVLLELAPHDLEILKLRVFNELTFTDIADRFNMTAKQVSRRFQQVLKHVRKFLKE